VDILLNGEENLSLNLPTFFYQKRQDSLGTIVNSGTQVVALGPLIYQKFQGVFQNNYANLPGVNDTLFSGACVPTKLINPVIFSFPTIVFVFQQYGNSTTQSFKLSLPPQSYLLLVLGPTPQYCLGITGTSGVGVVLGNIFLQNFYTVFDREFGRIGFSPVFSEMCTTEGK